MPNQYVALVTAISRLAETIFATREDAYNRKKDKEQEKAIGYAEQAFEEMSNMFVFIHEEIGIPEDKLKEYSKIKTRIYKLKGKFNKFD